MGTSDEELQRAVGRRMRAAAEAKGLKQVEVAQLMETAQSTISRWWSGDQPR